MPTADRPGQDEQDTPDDDLTTEQLFSLAALKLTVDRADRKDLQSLILRLARMNFAIQNQYNARLRQIRRDIRRKWR